MADFGAADPVAAATQAIRDYCGWHVAPVEEETLTLDGTGTDTLLLPSRLVVDVTSVKVRGEELPKDSYEWSTIGALRRLGNIWPDSYRSLRSEAHTAELQLRGPLVLLPPGPARLSSVLACCPG